MDEEHGLYLAGLAMTSEKTVTIEHSIRQLWMIVSSLQLTVTHPALHAPMRASMEQIGRDLCLMIVEALPEVEELLEMGWHREYDYIDDDDYGDPDSNANFVNSIDDDQSLTPPSPTADDDWIPF